jgi:iron complex transport system substrate-binding protein
MRIISIVPSFTEIIFSLGLGASLAGVTEHCDYPPETRKIDKVGTFAFPEVEKIISMRPDLVCADPLLHKNYVEKLTARGIEVYAPFMYKVDDLLNSMEYLGDLCNQKETAVRLVTLLKERLKNIRVKTTGKYRPRVFRIMSDDPVITPGPLSLQYDAIRLAGGALIPLENKAYVEVPWTDLANFDPQILLLCGRREGEPKRPRCKGCVSRNPMCRRQVEDIITGRWTEITAVKNDNIFTLSCHMLCRPGVRLIDGIERLNEYFM